jgi:uncharacterized protein YndB with AHSA1/START domain
MSVRKEPNGRRSIQVEVEVLGTPEEVWKAIATGPGISSWFVPARIENGPDGTPARMTLSFGPGMDSESTVTAWEPPRRLAAESGDLGPGAPTMATEWTVEARSGGTCVVRVVHSLFADTDDWDNQLEGVESGWPLFFEILTQYLSRFRGQPCKALYTLAFTPGAEADAWSRFVGPLGLAGSRPGQDWRSPAGAPAMSGTVDKVRHDQHHRHVLVRTSTPAPGIAVLTSCAMGEQTMLGLSSYFYGDAAEGVVARDEPGWQEWMKVNLGGPPTGQ